MTIITFFGATNINIDPALSELFIWIFILIILGGLGLIGWELIKHRNNERIEELEARKRIEFDPNKSVLNRGSLRLEIPRDTLEYYICEEVFSKPTKLHEDWVILQYARISDDAERPVYQAMQRINSKAKKSLLLEDNLLKRVKLKTALNEKYI